MCRIFRSLFQPEYAPYTVTGLTTAIPAHPWQGMLDSQKRSPDIHGQHYTQALDAYLLGTLDASRRGDRLLNVVELGLPECRDVLSWSVMVFCAIFTLKVKKDLLNIITIY